MQNALIAESSSAGRNFFVGCLVSVLVDIHAGHAFAYQIFHLKPFLFLVCIDD